MDEAKQPLMFDQQRDAHLRELYWRTPPWVSMSDRLPPGPGWYWVTVERDVQDDGDVSRTSRIDRWDGVSWITAGGYSTVTAWCWMPEPWDGVTRESSSLLGQG